MQTEKQNGTTAVKEIQIPEGDRYLFLRLSPTPDGQQSFQILFNDMATAILLCKVADETLTAELRKAFGIGHQATAPAIAIPGLDPRVLANLKKRGIGGS